MLKQLTVTILEMIILKKQQNINNILKHICNLIKLQWITKLIKQTYFIEKLINEVQLLCLTKRTSEINFIFYGQLHFSYNYWKDLS